VGGHVVPTVGVEMFQLVTGRRVEYGVVLVLMLLLVLVLVLVLLLVVVFPGLDVMAPTPTQYASPTQKFVAQSLDTAGFHCRNCACVIPYAVSTVPQSSPFLTRYQLLQFAGSPVMVGPGGLVTAPTPTQYASPTQKLVEQSLDTAGFHARNWAAVMPNLLSTPGHVSPFWMRYHLLHVEMVPVIVGPAGVEPCAAVRPTNMPPAAASRTAFMVSIARV
jgi:hypothetical protein